MEKCNCNCALREHLKECCGYGQLPPLLTKDTCPAPKPSCAAEKAAGAVEECSFPPVNTTCTPPADENIPAATACSANPADKPKCSMPDTDTAKCIPTWVCPPINSKMRTYPAPVGVIVLPISASGRNSSKKPSGKCGECGTFVKGESGPAPKVANKDCPMIRSRACNDSAAAKSDGAGGESLFAKLGALFSGKK